MGVHGWTFIAFGFLQVGVPSYTAIKHAEAVAQQNTACRKCYCIQATVKGFSDKRYPKEECYCAII